MKIKTKMKKKTKTKIRKIVLSWTILFIVLIIGAIMLPQLTGLITEEATVFGIKINTFYIVFGLLIALTAAIVGFLITIINKKIK